MEQKKVKNLTIGWVVKANVVSEFVSPGFTPQRKIVYKDYDNYGVDVLYKNKELPIIYPVVDFSNAKDTSSLEDGEYVIVPFGTVTTYLNEYGITLEKKINFIDKFKIKKIIFGDKKVLFSKKIILSFDMIKEISLLTAFKLYSDSIEPMDSEYDYLDKLSSAKMYRK